MADGQNPGVGTNDHDEAWADLAAAYGLGALSAEDAARLRPHLSHCPECRSLTAAGLELTTSLALAVEERAASPGLKERLFAQIQPAPPPAAAPIPLGRNRRPAPWLAWGAGLAAALVIAALLWQVIALQRTLDDQRSQLARRDQLIALVASGARTYVVRGTDAAPNAGALVVAVPDSQTGLAFVHGLQPAPAGQVYQFWLQHNGTARVAATFVPQANGESVLRLDLPVQGAEAAMVTLEPANAPTTTHQPGPQVIIGTLS